LPLPAAGAAAPASCRPPAAVGEVAAAPASATPSLLLGSFCAWAPPASAAAASSTSGSTSRFFSCRTKVLSGGDSGSFSARPWSMRVAASTMAVWLAASNGGGGLFSSQVCARSNHHVRALRRPRRRLSGGKPFCQYCSIKPACTPAGTPFRTGRARLGGRPPARQAVARFHRGTFAPASEYARRVGAHRPPLRHAG